MSRLTILGYLCLFLAFIFGIVGMSIDPKLADMGDDHNTYSHTNVEFKNITFSLFAQTLAVMGLGFLYAGKN